MKVLHELEDAAVGILLGILIFFYSGIIAYRIPFINFIFPAVVCIFLVLNILDIIFFAKDLKEYLKLALLSFVINIIDIVINLSFISKIFSVQIPFITETIMPFITGTNAYFIALYLIIANVIWFVWYFKD
jgi:hypothetical protein